MTSSNFVEDVVNLIRHKNNNGFPLSVRPPIFAVIIPSEVTQVLNSIGEQIQE